MRLAAVPSYHTQRYQGTTNTVRHMDQLARGPRGERSMKLRMTVEDIVSGVEPRDRVSQLAAIYAWFNDHFHYINDPVEVELVKDPERLLEEIERRNVAMGDCDDAATFLFAAPRTIGIPTEFLRVGFKANAPMGGRLTHVLVCATDQYGRRVLLDPVAGKRVPNMVERVKHAVRGY